MPKENNIVLISRTRVKKRTWEKLKLIAQIMSERTGKETTREDLVRIGLDSTVRYYEEELGL